jgi:branched-chain amino acid transport system permease protein
MSVSVRRLSFALLLLAVAGATVCVPLFAAMPAYYLNLVMQASTYAIAVFGLTIVLGYCGQINLAQAAFFGFGAYGVALGTTALAWPFWVSLALGVALAAVAGATLGFTSLRLGGHYLAMVTISFQTIMTLVMTNWIDVTRGPDGVTGIGRPAIFGHDFSQSNEYLALCLVILYAVGYLVWKLKRTRLGRAMQAVRDNELAAGVAGVNAYATKVKAFTLSAILGGLGGGLFAGGFAYISPDQFSFNESVVFLTMALLGGVGSPFGTALGTGLLILLPEWLRFLKVIYLAVYGGAVILVMVFMPDGIWGFVAGFWRRLRPSAAPKVNIVPPLPLTVQAAADQPGDAPVVLALRGLSKHFGGLKAVDGVDLEIRRNTVHALIGPNGSGKTTLLNVLSGIYSATHGEIVFDGRRVEQLNPHARTALGMGRTFQNIRLFGGLSVLENVEVGAERPNNAIPAGPGGLAGLALSALQFVGVSQHAGERVQSLSYGHQRWVEIARALAGKPTLLLLDEPGAGLNHPEKQELVGLLKRLKGHGLSVLIIDHDMNLVEQVADHITVLNFGRRIADGAPDEVLRHPEVIAAYLGEAEDEHAAA